MNNELKIVTLLLKLVAGGHVSKRELRSALREHRVDQPDGKLRVREVGKAISELHEASEMERLEGFIKDRLDDLVQNPSTVHGLIRETMGEGDQEVALIEDLKETILWSPVFFGGCLTMERRAMLLAGKMQLTADWVEGVAAKYAALKFKERFGELKRFIDDSLDVWKKEQEEEWEREEREHRREMFERHGTKHMMDAINDFHRGEREE